MNKKVDNFWHCPKCGNRLFFRKFERELSDLNSKKENIEYDLTQEDMNLIDEIENNNEYSCSNQKCFHHENYLHVFNPLKGYESERSSSYAIGWVN